MVAFTVLMEVSTLSRESTDGGEDRYLTAYTRTDPCWSVHVCSFH